MFDFSKYSDNPDALVQALLRVGGTSHIKFRYDLLRNGVKKSSLIVTQGQVSANREDQIKRTARFTIKASPEIDWLNDRIRPIMEIQANYILPGSAYPPTWRTIDQQALTWKEIAALGYTWYTIDTYIKEDPQPVSSWIDFPLGVYIPSTPTMIYENGSTYYEVECYDETVILREDCLTENLYFPEGEPYLDAVKSILASSGIPNVAGDDSDLVLPTAREFEIGESKLSVVNRLLSEINFRDLEVSNEGNFLLKKYREPTPNDAIFRYKADNMSIMGERLTLEEDYYNVPNVFVATVSNPEMENNLYSKYVNDNPALKTSTIQRGRSIVRILDSPEAITGQAELDQYVKRQAWELNQVSQVVSFSTALMPIHGVGDVIQLDHPGASGAFLEIGWDMSLVAGGEMNHRVKRLVNL